jgi:lipopolysaccharide transport system ATP-binding protein
VLRFHNPSQSTLENFHVAIGIDSPAGERITQLSSAVIGADDPLVSGSASRIVFEIQRTPLMPGRYPVTVFSTINGYIADWIQNAGFIEVADGDYYGSGTLLPQGQGAMLLDYNFQVD